MLAAVGFQSLDAQFIDVPDRHRFPQLNLPKPFSELELEQEMRHLSDRNRPIPESDSFLGAGAYNHHVPAIVSDILRRAEFYTAYTPYQPELSQGMLQAMYEYQSMICRLTGMEVSNASHYDGATSLAEAVLLSLNLGRPQRKTIIVSPGLNPQYRQILSTYLRGQDATVSVRAIPSTINDDTAAVVVQSPNFFGQFECLDGLAKAVHDAGALLVVVGDPIAMGLFKPPGAFGADIVVAEGQSLGIALSFGGPHLGIFATRGALVRKMAGRLVGETVDAEGARGFVLTLATREQHIRRARATSNICTNAALTALAAAVYLAAMGRNGLRSVAELCYHKSHYAADRIREVAGLNINPQAPDGVFFKEFVVDLGCPAAPVCRRLADEFGLIAGYDLGQVDPARANQLLVAVTETNSRGSIDRLAEALRRVIR